MGAHSVSHMGCWAKTPQGTKHQVLTAHQGQLSKTVQLGRWLSLQGAGHAGMKTRVCSPEPTF